MTDRRPQLIALLKEVVRGELALVHTNIAGVVQAYDQAQQTATVRITTAFSRRDPDTGQRETYTPPPLPNVPILWPAGGGGDFSDTWPLERGDEVWLSFAERSIDEWVLTGDDLVEPLDPRRFNLSDAVAVPAKSSRGEPLPDDAVASGARVIRGPELRLGSASASDFVALASLVESELNALWAAFNTHIHLGVTPGGGVSGIPQDATGTAGGVAAGKVKAE